MPAQLKLFLPFLLLSLVVFPVACTLYEQDTDETPTQVWQNDGGYPSVEDAQISDPPPNASDAGLWEDDAGYWEDDAGLWEEDAGPWEEDAGLGPDCFNLSETHCNVTDGCRALYEGVGCVCDAQTCECEAWEFDRCE